MSLLEIIGAFSLFFIIVLAILVTANAGQIKLEYGKKTKVWGDKNL